VTGSDVFATFLEGFFFVERELSVALAYFPKAAAEVGGTLAEKRGNGIDAPKAILAFPGPEAKEGCGPLEEGLHVLGNEAVFFGFSFLAQDPREVNMPGSEGFGGGLADAANGFFVRDALNFRRDFFKSFPARQSFHDEVGKALPPQNFLDHVKYPI